jgi:hypothetical protein
VGEADIIIIWKQLVQHLEGTNSFGVLVDIFQVRSLEETVSDYVPRQQREGCGRSSQIMSQKNSLSARNKFDLILIGLFVALRYCILSNEPEIKLVIPLSHQFAIHHTIDITVPYKFAEKRF